MSQIDVILKFSSRAEARNDPIIVSHYEAIEDVFYGDRIIPNLKVWRVSQNINGVPQPLAGWFMAVSLESGRIPNVLRDHAAVQIVINRDKAEARLTGMVIRSTVSAPVLQDMRFEPVFAGSDYPWGAWQ